MTLQPVFLAANAAGASLILLFSVLALGHALRLRQKDPDNPVWGGIFWVCLCMAGVAAARWVVFVFGPVWPAAGHGTGMDAFLPVTWSLGAMLLLAAAALTLFFSRAWNVHQAMLSSKNDLAAASEELMRLNQAMAVQVNDPDRDTGPSFLRHEKQMAQTDRMASIGQLSSGIAHEINNPLGIIQGYTQLLMRGEDPDSQKYQDLQIILKHARNCKTIVEDLLHFARRSAPEKSEVNICAVIEDVLVFLRHRGKMSKIDIETCYDEHVPSMHMDEKKIRQVLINLLMNARHAVGEQGHITVSTRYDKVGRHVMISVADDGYGIDEKNIDRIFDPFFTTKSTGEGTGLGLAVSYGIIKNHGGEIRVESEPGKGSVFTVILPVNTAKDV